MLIWRKKQYKIYGLLRLKYPYSIQSFEEVWSDVTNVEWWSYRLLTHYKQVTRGVDISICHYRDRESPSNYFLSLFNDCLVSKHAPLRACMCLLAFFMRVWIAPWRLAADAISELMPFWALRNVLLTCMACNAQTLSLNVAWFFFKVTAPRHTARSSLQHTCD